MSRATTAPLKRLLDAIKDGTHGTFQRVDEGRPLLSAKNVQNGRLDMTEEESQISDADFRTIVSNGFPRRGDVLLTIVGTIGRSCVFANDEPMAFQRSVAFLRPQKGVNERYLSYLLQSSSVQEQLALATKSAAQGGVYMGDVWEAICTYVPRSEHERIANFLDEQTARIDALIAEKERLVECLAELRYSTVSWAVTGGLHREKGTFKTGNAFVPELPAGWTLGGLTKYIGQVVDYRGKTPEKVAEGVLLVTAKNIRDGFLDYEASAEYVRPEDYEEIMRRGKPQVGDVLFTTEAPLGQVANVDREDIALAQRVVKFRGIDGVLNNYFLKFWLMGDAAQATLSTLATGSTAEGIKASKFGQIPVAIPTISEQAEIVDFLSSRRAAIDGAVDHVRHHIARLREYRSSLISAAVTGQLDLGSFKATA